METQAKVINIFTREEITEMPATKEQGEAMIEFLLNEEIKRNPDLSKDSDVLIDILIATVENNTGASRFDVMDKIYQKRGVVG